MIILGQSLKQLVSGNIILVVQDALHRNPAIESSDSGLAELFAGQDARIHEWMKLFRFWAAGDLRSYHG
jgi:hypothetical protein